MSRNGQQVFFTEFNVPIRKTVADRNLRQIRPMPMPAFVIETRRYVEGKFDVRKLCNSHLGLDFSHSSLRQTTEISITHLFLAWTTYVNNEVKNLLLSIQSDRRFYLANVSHRKIPGKIAEAVEDFGARRYTESTHT